MSNDTRVAVSDAAAPTDNAHVAQDSSKPLLPNNQLDQDTDVDNGAESTADQSTDLAPDEKEFGGQAGPDPTRYGDWEKKGRVTDF